MYTYTMDYYSAINKIEFLPCATMWMGLEDIMLSRITQSEKDNYMISFMWNLRNKPDHRGKRGKNKTKSGRQTIRDLII